MSDRDGVGPAGSSGASIDADLGVALRAISAYGFSAEVAISVVNISENATYRVEDPGTGQSAILRVHRVDYHSRAAIESELAWMSALRDETGLWTSEAIANADGELVTVVSEPGVDRYVVLFHVVPGVEPDDAALSTEDFRTLGAMTARMHLHSRSWIPPESFTRFAWDWESTLGERPRWGRWQDGFGVGELELEVLGLAAEIVERRLEAYGKTPDRFGLVHADLRLANLLVEDDLTTVIDFDDSGFSWFMYDFGTAVSFIEHDSRLSQWRAAWLSGYRSVTPLAPEHEAMLPTFVMLRRLLLVAWMGSHSHSRECQALGPGYTFDSVALADRYIATDGAEI